MGYKKGAIQFYPSAVLCIIYGDEFMYFFNDHSKN